MLAAPSVVPAPPPNLALCLDLGTQRHTLFPSSFLHLSVHLFCVCFLQAPVGGTITRCPGEGGGEGLGLGSGLGLGEGEGEAGAWESEVRPRQSSTAASTFSRPCSTAEQEGIARQPADISCTLRRPALCQLIRQSSGRQILSPASLGHPSLRQLKTELAARPWTQAMAKRTGKLRQKKRSRDGRPPFNSTQQVRTRAAHCTPAQLIAHP